MVHRWYFPENAAGGQPEGLNDSGVESFRGNQIESLAREIIQNSTDAIRDENKPVKVSFEKFELDANDFPDKEGLLNSFKSCREYKRTPAQAKSFYDKGIKILENKNITFLQVSDFNTTGLRGVNEEASDWENLVKSVGISNKGGSAGGSFGIGKSAPFACSYLRSVFYRTLNEENEKGFQGVARLASHFDGKNETRGTGFYGEIENTRPITNGTEIPNWSKRDDFGTDIFIAGFINDKGWQEKIIIAVIENFFMAIHQGKLIVQVDKIEINDSNLKMLIDEHIKSNSKLFSNEYYSALVFGTPIEKDIRDLGKVQLYLNKNEEFSKKVAMVRSTGMKIKQLDRFRGGSKFSGVLLIKGELNEHLRKCEPPAHDKWEASRHDDPKFAEKIIKEINDFVRESVKKMNVTYEENKIDFKGLNRFLPDYLNEENPLEENKIDDGDSKFVPESMKISLRRNKKKNRTELATNKAKSKKRTRKKKDDNDLNKKKKKWSSERNSKSKINVTKVRSIIVNKGSYDIKVGTKTGGKGSLTINFIGEDSRSYKTNIISAIDLEANKKLPVNDNMIGPIDFYDNDKRIIRVDLDEKIRASLEVIVNEG